MKCNSKYLLCIMFSCSVDLVVVQKLLFKKTESLGATDMAHL